MVGGTASVIGGGSFENGAMTGAFSRLFNDDNAVKKELNFRRYAQANGWIDKNGNPVRTDSPQGRAQAEQAHARMATFTDAGSTVLAISAVTCAAAEPCGVVVAGGLATGGAVMGIANAVIERSPAGFSIDYVVDRAFRAVGNFLGAPVLTTIISEGVKHSPEMQSAKDNADKAVRGN